MERQRTLPAVQGYLHTGNSPAASPVRISPNVIDLGVRGKTDSLLVLRVDNGRVDVQVVYAIPIILPPMWFLRRLFGCHCRSIKTLIFGLQNSRDCILTVRPCCRYSDTSCHSAPPLQSADEATSRSDRRSGLALLPEGDGHGLAPVALRSSCGRA